MWKISCEDCGAEEYNTIYRIKTDGFVSFYCENCIENNYCSSCGTTKENCEKETCENWEEEK